MSKKEWGKGSKKDRLEENITVKKKLIYEDNKRERLIVINVEGKKR